VLKIINNKNIDEMLLKTG